ncbi:MAG: UbiD family decarboxylase [Clostridia bacterium]|nr:MAG: UbiD family decarboxylase [Clostridia bacterium]
MTNEVPRFPFRSLRDWIVFLEQNDQLRRNKKEVNLRYDLGYISKVTADTGGPALIHENIYGYPDWKIFCDGLTTFQRKAWALGLPLETLAASLAGVIQSGNLIKPVLVDTGPCKEVKIFGDNIDLTNIPIPYTGKYDNPPYITAGISTIMDLDTGWHNIAIRRFQLKGKQRLCDLIVSYQHEGKIFAKYVRAGKPMPIAIVIGADPLFYLLSQMPAEDNVSEWDYWGAFTGEPLQVVKCETNELLVPAQAEIVIEGFVDPLKREFEGPFSEFPGYYSGCYYLPVVDVRAVTMRKDAIYYYLYMGKEPSEGHSMAHLMYSAQILKQLKQLVPEVRDVNVLSTWSFTTAVTVDRRAKREGLIKKLAMAAKAIQAGALIKNLLVFDDNVDIRSLSDIIWSFSVKFQPARDFLAIPNTIGAELDPSEPSLGHGPGVSSFGVFDCTEAGPPYDEPFRREVALPPKSDKALEVLRDLGLNG